MEERFRLVFRGEVLEGQHPAVVKKRLGAALKVKGERLDDLFAGAPVVIRGNADGDETARYRAMFEKAGAHLQVLPVTDAEPSDAAVKAPDWELAPPGVRLVEPSPAPKPVGAPRWTVAPPGTVLLEDAPKPAPEPPDTSHLRLEEQPD